MKNLSFLVIVAALALGVVACGNKDKNSGSSNQIFSSDPYKVSTVRGYVVPQGRLFIVGVTTYNISPQSDTEMQRAFSLVQGVQPKLIPNNGQSGFLADLTGSVVSNGIQGSIPQQTQQGYGSTINVSHAVIHR